MQETTGAARYGDHVVDLFPSEGLPIRERPLLRRDANVVNLLPGGLSFLERLVQCLGLWVFPPEDRDIRSPI